MKNKSAHHMNNNTFKFLSFSERIANIDVDIFHHVAHRNEEIQLGVHESVFRASLDKWEVLNLTESYRNFRKEIKPQSLITLPQVLHNHERIVDTLIRHLNLKNVLYLQPILEHVLAISKDMGVDFFQYYSCYFPVFLDLLNTKDVEVLEWTLHCLAHLFKLLWRPLIANIDKIYLDISTLLSDNKPEYVNNFAAESFAFIARKVKDRKGFLNLILKCVKNQKNGPKGCGQLLFHVMLGMDGQLHSYSESFLPFLIDSLLEYSGETQIVLFDILEHVFMNIISKIHPQKNEIFWNSIEKSLDKFIDNFYICGNNITIPRLKNLNMLLTLIGYCIEYKNGWFLKNPLIIEQRLLKILSFEGVDIAEIQLCAIKVSLLLLNGCNMKLHQEHASNLTLKILSLKTKANVLYFIDNASESSTFYTLVLPMFLKFCSDEEYKKEALYILTKLIIKKTSISFDGMNLSNWKVYPLNFGPQNNELQNYLHEFITKFEVSNFLNNMDTYICATICLPHISSNTNVFTTALYKNIKNICDGKMLQNSELLNQRQKLLFIMNFTLQSLIIQQETRLILDLFDVLLDNLLPLCQNGKYIALRTVNLILTSLKDDDNVINVKNLEKVHNYLENNLNSPFNEIRLLTTHIYSLFELRLLQSQCDFNGLNQIFSLCYKIESISPQIDTYREQLNLLENLRADKTEFITKYAHFSQIRLRYLCGVLYLNFKLLWNPIIKIIATYANTMDITIFWQVFGEQLKFASSNVTNNMVICENFWEIELEFLNNLFEEASIITSKPDHMNYRLLLWTAMELFPNVAEAKTRDISELFIHFYETEYIAATSHSATSYNIKENASNIKSYKKNKSSYPDDIEDMNNKKTLLDDTSIFISDATKYGNGKVGRKNMLKTLLQYLTLFSKVHSPYSMYREHDLHFIYNGLLSHKNHLVQKLALCCLLCYKDKNLTPYADHLYSLIDPNSTKKELTTFRLDEGGGDIMEEHRATVVPIIIRVAFSKLTFKVGGKGQYWRGLVVRFVGGCSSNEMLEFLRVIFKQYEEFLANELENEHRNSTSNIMEQLEEVCKRVDLEKIIHPNCLLSTINLIQVIFETCGLLTDNILRFLLHILLVISSLIRGAYKQKQLVHFGYLPVLRLVKNQCQKAIGNFFERFYRFPFIRHELLSIFHFCVWPYLNELPIEGIHSPTALLRLLLYSWGSNPRFFPLLNIRDSDGKSVMPVVMELLMYDKCNVSVENAILDMIQRLLTLELDTVNDGYELELDEAKDCTISSNKDYLNYGSKILLPHLHQVMYKFRNKLVSSKFKTTGSRDLSILSRMSELITEESLCNQLLELLLPISINRIRFSIHTNEEVTLELLRTIQNLLRHIKEPSVHVRKFSPLFGIVALPSYRKIICETLKEIIILKKNQTEWTNMANLIVELNSYDSKWLDQPDFQRRLDGFKEITKIIRDDYIMADIGVLAIHNFYYLIAIENDLSLKDNAINCIKMITPKLLDAHPLEKLYIIDETVLFLIRTSLKHKDDVRADCIGILGYLARTCPQYHPVLRDLNILTNSDDPEVDFFENIIHLQVFRQGRALVKFCQIFRQQTQSPSSRTLTQFILPLTTQYLCNERYANRNNIIDAAIDAVGVICRLLPWHHYEGLLKYYLVKLRNELDFQKQLVRLIVVILDGFHFNLSKAQETEGVENCKDSRELQKGIDTYNPNVTNEIENDTDIEGLVSNDVEEPFADFSIAEIDVAIVAVDRITTPCKSTATKIIYTIKCILLPQLYRTLAELNNHEVSHRVNRTKNKSEYEDDDLVRVPISLAIVKLLQKLPENILDANLPGILMKLCSFLRSPLDSVRRCTRETLQKIMTSIQPKYLPILLDCITPLLLKGFQSHVLVYTIHAVLNSLRELFKMGDIDCILDAVCKLCMADLFGALADEKDVYKLCCKTSEARVTKSFDTLQILAQYQTENELMNLISPLNTVLLRTHAYKIIIKVQTCLRHIAQGLIENTYIRNKSLLSFCYGLSSASIPQLRAKLTKPLQGQRQRQFEFSTESCLIIPKAPVRYLNVLNNAKMTSEMNSYAMVEFGLNVLYLILKKNKLREEHQIIGIDIYRIREYLDPFVPLFEKCVESSHVKLCTITMQCLAWIIKYDLPSMKDRLSKFIKRIFSILHKYAAAGLSKGDNFDLVVAAFKTISTFLRHTSTSSSTTVTFSNNQLTLLLMYVEQDLHSYDRQATAFHLLRAILARCYSSPPSQLHNVILKTAELSVRSEMTHVRSEARSCVHQYMIGSSIGKKKMCCMIDWYLNQLSYDLEPGRLMVIETLNGLIYAFPQPLLKKYSGTFLMTMGPRLINDESPDCRKNISTTITTMFRKLPKDDMNELFEMIILWFTDDKIPTQQMAVQLISLVINVEKSDFERRVSTIAPIILAQFHLEIPQLNISGRFVRIQPKTHVTDEDSCQISIRDHYIFQLLKMLQRLAAHCPKFLQNMEFINVISIEVQALLGHAHEWVRLGAAQFLGYVLAAIDVEKLIRLLQIEFDVEKHDNVGYLYSNPQEQIKSLTLDLCAQLQPGGIRSELAEQIVKNLVFLAQVLQHFPLNKEMFIQRIETSTFNNKNDAKTSLQVNSDSESCNEDDADTNIRKAKINLMFLTKKMRHIVHCEIVETPTSTTLRTEVFKWIAAICKTLSISNVRFVLYHLLAPLIREINVFTTSDNDQQDHKDLRRLAFDVAKLIKNRVGIELYTETVTRVQRTLFQRRAARKRGRTQLALTEPLAFAKKKLRRQEKKRLVRKRKVAAMKGEFRPLKRRCVIFKDNNDM